jgi:hypothetical protein
MAVSLSDVTAPDRELSTEDSIHAQLNVESLWHERWPYIALQVCVDAVGEVPKESREEIRWSLPCADCSESDRCLTAKEREIGSLLFDREQRTKPRAQGSSLFPRERMEKVLDYTTAMSDYYRKPYGKSGLVVGSAWDFAWSERAGGDWLTKVTGVMDRENGNMIDVLDINRWQQLEFQAQCELIIGEHAKYNDDFVVFEEAAAQLVWRQYVTSKSSVPVVPHGVNEKKDLLIGIPGLIIDVDNRKWRFPFKSGTRNHEVMEQFLSECENFGWSGDKLEGVGEHDDLVVAWWHLRWGFTRYRVPPGKVGLIDRGEEQGTEI